MVLVVGEGVQEARPDQASSSGLHKLSLTVSVYLCSASASEILRE